MTVSLWQDASAGARHRSELLVVGAGISGASAAYWLAERGLDVAVVDAGSVGHGASGKSAGMMLLGTADPYSRVVDIYGRERAREIWAFTAQNRALLQERVLDASEDAALRLVRTGTVSGAVSEHEWAELERSGQLLAEDGYPQETLDAQAMAEALGGTLFHGGLRDPGGMTVDPLRLTRRILELARAGGAQLFEHHPVFRIEDTDTGVLVWTAAGCFETEMVLLCTNAYSPLVHPWMEGRVYPTRGQMLATAPLPKRVVPWGIYADFGYEYFWQLDTGEVVAGGWRQHAEDAEKGYSDETSDIVQDGIRGFLGRAVPALADVPITHRWGGVMGFSGDGFPFIGELPGRPRIKTLAGHTGHGLGFAFLSAKRLVDMAIDGESIGWLGAGRRSLVGG